MPFKSEKQRRWMWANEPEMARRWEHKADGGPIGGNMKLKKQTIKDRYGNTVSYEYEGDTKQLDPTRLMEKQMDMMMPEPMAEPPAMAMTYDHPGEPRGSDTVPAWLTPGEFVVNAEAMRIPGAAEQVEKINNMGRAVQQAQGGSIGHYSDGGLQPVPGLSNPETDLGGVYRAGGGFMDMLKAYGEGFGDVSEEIVGKGIEATKGFGQLVGKKAADTKDRASKYYDSLSPYGQGAIDYMEGSIPLYSTGKDIVRIYDGATQVWDGDKGGWKDIAIGGAGVLSPLSGDQLIGMSKIGGQMLEDVQHRAPGGEIPRNTNPFVSANEFNAMMQKAPPEVEAEMIPNLQGFTSLEDLLAEREGFREEIYLDSLGKPTIGYGRLIEDAVWDPSDKRIGTKPYTREQLEQFKKDDIKTAKAAAKRNVGKDTWDKLSTEQQWALTSQAFQLGGTGQAGFENMIKAIKAGDMDEAARQAYDSKWYGQTPKRTHDLAMAFSPEVRAQYKAGGGIMDFLTPKLPSWAGGSEDNVLADVPGAIGDFLTPKLPSWAGGSEDNVLAGLVAPAEGVHSIDEFSDITTDVTQPDVARHEMGIPGLEAMDLPGYEAPALPEDETPIYRQTEDDLIQMEIPEEVQAQAAASEAVKQQKSNMGKGYEAVNRELEKFTKGAASPQAQAEADVIKAENPDTVTAAGSELAETPEGKGFFDNVLASMTKEFKDIASPENIGAMALKYLGSRALGYSHEGSFNWAAKDQLASHYKFKEEVTEVKKSGKFTPDSIKAYERTKDAGALVPKPVAPKRIGAKPSVFYGPKGQKINGFEYQDANGNKYIGDKSGNPLNTDALHQDEWKVKGTKAYNDRVNNFRKVSTDQLKSLRKQFGQVGQTSEGKAIYATDINPETQAGEIAKWAAKNDVAPEELAGLVSSAYQDALNDNRQDGKKARDLTPYLNQLVVRNQVANPDIFRTADGNLVGADKLATVNRVIENQLRAAGKEGNVKNVSNQYYNAKLEEWLALGTEGQKRYNNRANADENGFYLFVAEDLGLDDRVK